MLDYKQIFVNGISIILSSFIEILSSMFIKSSEYSGDYDNSLSLFHMFLININVIIHLLVILKYKGKK